MIINVRICKGPQEQSHYLCLSAKATGMELKRILSTKTGILAKMYDLVQENKQILLHKNKTFHPKAISK